MAQPQYWIQATRRCATHKPGTVICYTGPRAGVGKGWRVLGRAYEAQWACGAGGMSGLL